VGVQPFAVAVADLAQALHVEARVIQHGGVVDQQDLAPVPRQMLQATGPVGREDGPVGDLGVVQHAIAAHQRRTFDELLREAAGRTPGHPVERVGQAVIQPRVAKKDARR
jgi:hypothetical protein